MSEPPIALGRYEAARARLCRIGAVCAVLNVVTQAFQDVAYRFFIPDIHSPVAAIEARALPMDIARGAVVLFSILLLFGVFAATAFDRVRRAPAAAFTGFSFTLLFVAFELGHRAIDLFFVSGRWARAYRSTQDESLKQVLVDRVAQWDGITDAIYFPLVLTAMLGAACFALSLRGERGWPARLGLIAWTIQAVRVGLRTLGYAGIDALQPFNDAIYFPAIVVVYSLLAVWLWNAAKTTRPA